MSRFLQLPEFALWNQLHTYVKTYNRLPDTVEPFTSFRASYKRAIPDNIQSNKKAKSIEPHDNSQNQEESNISDHSNSPASGKSDFIRTSHSIY